MRLRPGRSRSPVFLANHRAGACSSLLSRPPPAQRRTSQIPKSTATRFPRTSRTQSKARGQFLPRFPCRSLNRLRDVRYPDHATDRDDEAIAFRDGSWSPAAISVAACQATESASANISIFMKTSPMRISRLRRDSARCARLFDRLRSFPTCSAHIHRLGCPPSAPDRRLATPLRHSLRGHKKKGCTRVRE